MKLILSKIYSRIFYPGRKFKIFQRKYFNVKFFTIISKFFSPLIYLERKKAIKKYFPETKIVINPDDGFKIIDFKKNEQANKAINACKKIYSKINWKKYQLKDRKKASFITLQLDIFDPANRRIIDFATSEFLINIISKYIGSVPVFCDASINVSPNDAIHDNSAQIFHIDRDEHKQIKFYLYLDDVTERDGPFCLIPANQSKEIFYKIEDSKKKNFFSDEEIYKAKKEINLVKLTGKKGDGILADTASCLHYGSRPIISKKTKPRIALLLWYQSAFSPMMPIALKFKKKINFNNVDKKKKKILDLVLGLHHLNYRRRKDVSTNQGDIK